MASIIDRVVDLFLYVFSREKYNYRIVERKMAPFKAKYYGAVEAELQRTMGPDTWPLFLHAQASDPTFLEAVSLLYEKGFMSRRQPASLVRYLVHGLFVYSTRSKPEGVLAIIRATKLIDEDGPEQS
jgi:hypothetical protein